MVKLQRFRNRMQAGMLLAGRLANFARRKDVVILALPRGGVPVGFTIARLLEVKLDVFIVRKLGMPNQPELALGAIASGGLRVLRRDVEKLAGVPMDVIDAIAEREAVEVTRRETLYRGGRPPLALHDMTVILVDDGVATGATMLAAIYAIGEAAPASIIAAVPVAPVETLRMLRSEVDRVVCLRSPEPFHAVGAWYEDFAQTSDEEVRELLERASVEWARDQGSQHAPM